MMAGKFQGGLNEGLLEEGNSILETTRHGRRVENDKAHLLPEIALVLPADDADSALEFFTVDPEFAIERHSGQAFDEPFWRVIDVALAGKELFAVPVGADAIELFAHPP